MKTTMKSELVGTVVTVQGVKWWVDVVEGRELHGVKYTDLLANRDMGMVYIGDVSEVE